MYRKSDSNCTGPDAAPPAVKNDLFKERWDCLSKSASQKVSRNLIFNFILSKHLLVKVALKDGISLILHSMHCIDYMKFV